MGQGRKPDPREQYKSLNIPGFCPPPRNCGCCCSGLHSPSRRQKAKGRKPGPRSESRLSAQPHFGDERWQARWQDRGPGLIFNGGFHSFIYLRPTGRLVQTGSAGPEGPGRGRGWKFGYPKSFRTDNARTFDNHLVQCLMQLVGSSHNPSIPYRPQSNGQVERVNAEGKRVGSGFVRSD